MIIKSYDFGQITVNQELFTSDLIIYSGKINSSWWRKKGHLLQLVDINEIINEKPEVIVIGTGYYGYMKIAKEVIKKLEDLSIKFYIEKTKKAVDLFNSIDSNNIIAAFHLTC